MALRATGRSQQCPYRLYGPAPIIGGDGRQNASILFNLKAATMSQAEDAMAESRNRDQQQAANEQSGGRQRQLIAPPAPGAIASPQYPGEVPDHSTVPGEFSTQVPRATEVRRPLSEEGTAQAIMGVYAASGERAMDPARFEQSGAAYEEMRKAYPAQLPPTRPAPGYALRHGDAMASELQAIEAPRPAPAVPVIETGEAALAQPGGSSAPAARGDDSAAEVGSAFAPSDAPASVRAPEDAAAGTASVAESGEIGVSAWAEAGADSGEANEAAQSRQSEDGDESSTTPDRAAEPPRSTSR